MTPERLAELSQILDRTSSTFSPVLARELLDEVKRLRAVIDKITPGLAEFLDGRMATMTAPGKQP